MFYKRQSAQITLFVFFCLGTCMLFSQKCAHTLYLELGGKHKMEIGVGILTGFGKDAIGVFSPNAAIMYRFQSPKGFILRIGFTPTLLSVRDKESIWIPENTTFVWGGLSIGHRL